MAVELESVSFVSSDPEGDAAFWAGVLGRRQHVDGSGILVPGPAGQVGLRFVQGAPRGALANRLHLHLIGGGRTQRDTITLCEAHGGALRGSGHVPEDSYAAMADVVGDGFCVIEDGNAYLAGCGPLGEVTCEGTRTVGLFWSRALGWPVVWDKGEEIAIQSPVGGTKIAWSGEPVDQNTARDRQSFVLTAPAHQVDDETRRLIALGAAPGIGGEPGVAALRDPDGVEFSLRAPWSPRR